MKIVLIMKIFNKNNKYRKIVILLINIIFQFSSFLISDKFFRNEFGVVGGWFIASAVLSVAVIIIMIIIYVFSNK